MNDQLSYVKDDGTLIHKNHILSDRLKQLRKERNLSQADIGNLLHVTKTQISDIENARRTTTIDNLVTLAQFFNVSTDYLLGLSNNPKRRL